MKPQEIKARTFGSWLMLAGAPFFAFQSLGDLNRLSAIPFASHPLSFAARLGSLLIDASFMLLLGVSGLTSVGRSLEPVLVSEDGVQVGAGESPLENFKWTELSELRRVFFGGGLDAIDLDGATCARLPAGWMFMNDFVPTMEDQLRRSASTGPSETEIDPFGMRGLRTALYLAACYFLFFAYAGFTASETSIGIGFTSLAVVTLGFSELFRRTRYSIAISDDSITWRRPPFAPRSVPLAMITGIRIWNLGALLHVRLQSSGLSQLGVPLMGPNSIFWYRTLIAEWERSRAHSRQDGAPAAI